MRVAVIASPWVPVPPPGYGGTEAVVDQLVRGLAERGHEVVLYAHPHSTAPVELVAPVRARDIGPIGHGPSELAHVLGAYADAARRGVDLVHDHTLVGPLACAWSPGPPVVVTNHGPFDRATLPVFEAVAEHASVVAISHAQAGSAGGVPVAAVVHHGVDVAAWPQGHGGDYVLFLGRMHPDKGPARAIQLARAAGVPLVLAAKLREPLEQAYFEAEVQPLLGPEAVFVGEVGGRRKRALLAGARALLNPIAWPEPFGMVMVEALACGTPVVTSPLGAAPEIVVDGVTGRLCDSDDEFVRALRSLRDLDRRVCRADVARRFSRTAMVDGYLEVYATARAAAGLGDLRRGGLRRGLLGAHDLTEPGMTSVGNG